MEVGSASAYDGDIVLERDAVHVPALMPAPSRLHERIDEALWAFLVARGFDAPRLAIAYFNYSGQPVRGCVALDDARAEDVILRAPRSLFIDANMLASHAVLKDVFAFLERHGSPKPILYTVWLMHEAARGAHSPWAVYVSFLRSQSVRDFPLLHPEDKSPLLQEMAAGRRAVLAAFFRGLRAVLTRRWPRLFGRRRRHLFSFNLFLWAFTMVKSRIFNHDDEEFMLMGADLLNNAPQHAMASDYDTDDKGTFFLRADVPIRRGTEVRARATIGID